MSIMKSFWNWLTDKDSKRQFEGNSQAAFFCDDKPIEILDPK